MEHARAGTPEVLGAGAFGSGGINPAWQEHFEQLIRMLEVLAEHRHEHVQSFTREPESNSRENLANQGTDEYERGAAMSLISSDQDALNEVEQALQRIRDGTYGRCESTGKMIEPERLQAVPWTRYCLEAETRLEQEKARRKPRHVF